MSAVELTEVEREALRQKMVITREDYDRGRAVLDALPPGYYVKCAECSGWYTGGTFVLGGVVGGGPVCERCR